MQTLAEPRKSYFLLIWDWHAAEEAPKRIVGRKEHKVRVIRRWSGRRWGTDVSLEPCNSDHGSGVVEAKLLPPQQQTRIVVQRFSEAKSSARLGGARAELDVLWT